MKRKNIGTILVLAILTCGIYYLIWLADTQDQINSVMQDGDTSGGVTVLLTILTCGVYGWYWYYKTGQKIARIQQCNGLPVNDKSILYIIMGVMGLGIINMAIMQGDLNAMTPA